MRTPITFPQLEAKIRELVAANPDYIYSTSGPCLYNPRGDVPACIFGRAFIELGYPIPNSLESNSIDTILPALLSEGFAVKGLDRLWAAKLQTQQDIGATWRHALRVADELREAERGDNLEE